VGAVRIQRRHVDSREQHSIAGGHIYFRVLATSNIKSSAETWPKQLIDAIEKTQSID